MDLYCTAVLNKEDEMSGACSTYGRNDKYIKNVGLKT
jgi:hypothetical protein